MIVTLLVPWVTRPLKAAHSCGLICQCVGRDALLILMAPAR